MSMSRLQIIQITDSDITAIQIKEPDITAIEIREADMTMFKQYEMLKDFEPGTCYKSIKLNDDLKPFFNDFGKSGYALNANGIRIVNRMKKIFNH